MLLHHQRRQSRHHHFCACSCLNDFNADDNSSVETHKWNGIVSTVSEGFVLLFPRGLWPLLPPPPKFHRPFSLHHTLLQLPFPLALIPSHPTAISSPISLYRRHHCVPSFLYPMHVLCVPKSSLPPYLVSPGPCDPPTLCPLCPPVSPGPCIPCSLVFHSPKSPMSLQPPCPLFPCPLVPHIPPTCPLLSMSLPCVPELPSPPALSPHVPIPTIPLFSAPSSPLSSTLHTKAKVLWCRGGRQSWLGVPRWSH